MDVYHNENMDSNLLSEEGMTFNAKKLPATEDSTRGSSPLTQKNVQQFDSAFHHESGSQYPRLLRTGAEFM